MSVERRTVVVKVRKGPVTDRQCVCRRIRQLHNDGFNITSTTPVVVNGHTTQVVISATRRTA